MRSILVITMVMLCIHCSAQTFTFAAYLRTDGDDKIHSESITCTIDTSTATFTTTDTTWSHRVVSRREWPSQSEIKLSCGGRMTIYYDYGKMVESVFYHCPSMSIFSSHGFVRAFRDGEYLID